MNLYNKIAIILSIGCVILASIVFAAPVINTLNPEYSLKRKV